MAVPSRPSHGHAQPASGSDPRPEVRAEVAARAEAGARTEAAAPAQAGARAEITGRAVIGDHLRMPVMWCEMGSCISWYAHPRLRSARPTPAPARSAPAAHRCPSWRPAPGASRPTPASGPPARSCRGTGTRPSPGPPGSPPGPATAPPATPRRETAATSATRPPSAGAGMAPPVPGRSDHPAVGAPNTPPARPFPPRGLERGPGRARLRRPPDAPGKPASIRD